MKNNPSGYSTMSPALAGARNYYRWLYRLLAPRLGQKVLEIGPGRGQMAGLLTAGGRDYWAADTDAGVIENLKAAYPAAAARFICGDITSAEAAARVAPGGIDTILMMNILEHVEDDVAFLKTLRQRFPGCRGVLQLPALPALYGRMDREAGHYRRYTAAGARRALLAAGYRPEEVFYFNFIGAITWFISSRIAGFSLQSGAAGRCIGLNDRFIIPLSFIFEPFTRKLAGQSVIAVGS